MNQFYPDLSKYTAAAKARSKVVRSMPAVNEVNYEKNRRSAWVKFQFQSKEADEKPGCVSKSSIFRFLQLLSLPSIPHDLIQQNISKLSQNKRNNYVLNETWMDRLIKPLHVLSQLGIPPMVFCFEPSQRRLK